MSLGIPIKVLHEAEGHIITCESSTGEVYRGKLVEAEEHMNLQVSSRNLRQNLTRQLRCRKLLQHTETEVLPNWRIFTFEVHKSSL